MKNNFYWIYLIVIIVTIYLTGCGGLGGAVNASTATAQARRAVEQATQVSSRLRQTQAAERQIALATAQAVETLLSEASQWPVVLKTSFDDNIGEWSVGADEEPDLATIEWSIQDGRYRWDARAIASFVWWVTPAHNNLGDFYLAVSARQIEGADSGEFGVIFRKNEQDEYYLFELSNNGYYALFLRTVDEWQTLIDWTETAAVQIGQDNRIVVTAQGSKFYVGLNGQPFTQFFHTLLDTGQVGLLVGLSDPGEHGVWEFDDFELRSPDYASITPSP
jgi:hypothetical protein